MMSVAIKAIMPRKLSMTIGKIRSVLVITF
jgi:hypothetical protein